MRNNIDSRSYRNGLKAKVLHAAAELFYSRGIRQVRMDDIARALSISKRTLYEIYDNKEQLLLDVINDSEKAMNIKLEALSAGGADTIEIIFQFYRLQMQSFSEINIAFFDDLHIYNSVIEHVKREHEAEEEQRNSFIRKAIEEGFFLEGLNYDVVFKIIEAASKNVREDTAFKEYDIKTVFHNFIMVFLRGICTGKGIKRLDELMAKHQ